MRKTLSLLIAIGILSSSFIACGTSSKDITNNESKILIKIKRRVTMKLQIKKKIKIQMT